jgi:ABC-type transport system substrate-binding protein
MRSVTGRFFSAVLVLLNCFVLAHCGEPLPQKPTDGAKTASSQPHSGGVYRTPLLNQPVSLDPARVEDIYSHNVVNQVFDGLVKFSQDLLITPALAKNWQIEDGGKLYRFQLREDARFHNGQAVTSRDVVFSLCRLLRTSPAPSILPHLIRIVGAAEYRSRERDDLPGLQSTNDQEVVVRLEEAYVPFLAALGMYQVKIVPESEVLRDEAGFARRPVGSGPFSFVSWDGNIIRLQRYSGYYGGPALLDELHYVIYAGGGTEEVLADFQNLRLHDMPVYGKVRNALLGQPNLQRFHRPSLSLLFYGMNCKNPLLQHADLRRALSLAIDREKLAATAYEGQFEPARCILPPGIPGYNPEHPKVVDNLSEAQKLLSRSLRESIAVAAPFELVSAVQSPLAKAEIDFVCNSWAALGITVVPKFIPDWTKFEEYLKSGSFQIYRYAWFVDLPDPDNIFQALFGSDSNVNYMHFHDQELDRRLQLARRVFPPMERAAMYQQIEDQVLQAQPLIPLVHLSIDHVYHANVHGITLNALGDHAISFHKVWLDASPRPGN